MRTIEVSKIGVLIKFQFKTRKKEIFGWSLAIFSIMFLYAALFPSVKDMAQLKMEAMPKELLQFVGMESFSDMGDYISYFGMIYGMLLIAISIFAVSFASRILLDEERNKSIEFLAAQELSRVEIYVSKYLSAFFAVLCLVCLSAFAGLLGAVIGGGYDFDFAKYASVVKISSITPFFFMSLSFALGGFSQKYGSATTGSFILMLSYMLGYLSKLLGKNGEWMVYLSPFETFSARSELALDSLTLLCCGIYVLLAAFLTVFGGYRYNSRDYQL